MIKQLATTSLWACYFVLDLETCQEDKNYQIMLHIVIAYSMSYANIMNRLGLRTAATCFALHLLLILLPLVLQIAHKYHWNIYTDEKCIGDNAERYSPEHYWHGLQSDRERICQEDKELPRSSEWQQHAIDS